MKKIKRFIDSNKLITKVFIISLVIHLSYKITMDIPEIITGADVIYNLFSDLSLSYMASFIFYILISYIPEIKRQNKINKSIKRNISMVLKNMKSSIEYMAKDVNYNFEIDNLNNEDFEYITTNFNIYNPSPMVDSYGNHVTALKYINNYVYQSDIYIDRLYNIMIVDLDYNLIDILDDIRNSIFHNIYVSMAEANTPKAIEEREYNFLYEYYLIYKELEMYCANLQI